MSIDKVLDKLKERTAKEVEQRVNSHLPPALQLKLNPAAVGGADDEDDEDEDGEGGDEGEEVEGLSIAFEDAEPEDNLACAAAAYRVAGTPDHIIAQHKNGPAFFGFEEGLEEYCESKDLKSDDWEVWEDADEIFALDYDHDTLKKVIKLMEQAEDTYEDAEDFYQKFHWGNNPNVTVVKNIPGVTGTLVHLGVGRRIDYGANKEGKWAEYFHEFGENTDEYPSVYALMNEGETKPTCLIIHGGNMRVEGRGIVE